MTLWKMSLLATVLLAPLAGRVGAAPRELRLLAHSPQTDADAPTFEVASVKLNKSGDRFIGFTYQGGRFKATNVPLRVLIRNAYQVHDSQISDGPNWVNSDRFDIVAKGDVGASPAFPIQLREGASKLQLMMRALLVDRFKLAVHRETRQIPVYALVVARRDGRLGPELRRSDVDCAASAAAARREVAPSSNPPAMHEETRCAMAVGPDKSEVDLEAVSHEHA